MMVKKNILLALFLLGTANLYSQSGEELDREKITEILYQHTSDESPGVAVGIVKEGRIIYEQYMGYANLDYKIKVDENTRFNIASNAKQFTALCILKLIKQGSLNTDDDIRQFLPGLFEDIKSKITVSDLLTHTSGIRDVYGLWALKGQTWWQLFIDNEDAIELLRSQTDLNFEPGTAYLYSNSNYILLTAIIENVTGQLFSEYATELFLELGMSDTGFLTNYMVVVPNKARPYGNWSGWREYPNITETHGDGALFTSLKDQLKWEQIIQLNDGENIPGKLVKDSQLPVAGSVTNQYGYGLMFDTYKGMDYAYHDGGTGAYNATFLRFPEKQLAIVVASNNANVPTNYLAKQLADITLNLETINTVYPAMPDRIEKLKDPRNILGSYRNEEGTIIKITEKNGLIFRKIYQRDSIRLLNEKGGLFHYETNQDLKINFTNIGTPKQKFTIYLSSQEPSTFYRLPDSNEVGFDKHDLNGSFYNVETDTKILLESKDKHNYSIVLNGQKEQATLLLNDYLRMNDYEIKVIRDSDNKIIALSVDGDRIKNVIFNKMEKD
ncbi:MAG: serine hydrolase domain-containing protein [Cyclobacteriaceae bacterium]